MTETASRKQTHLTTPTPLLIDPDAPTDYGTGRRCERCKEKVNRYQKPYRRELLCERCRKKRVDERLKNPHKPEPLVQGPHHGVKLPRLERIRRRQGLSRLMLSEMANVSLQHISCLENGKRGAGDKVRRRLAKALGVAEWEMSEEVEEETC